LDGFRGFKTPTTGEPPDAAAVMGPIHIVRLAGDALGRCRRRVQQGLQGTGARSTRTTGFGGPCTRATNRSLSVSGTC
jgi:transposase